ncbi:ribbon-helix-helix domain-containing protein [Blautia schinkii]|nr:ribbon-helix-helix domain-containing protein [Blautia schinkii]
MDKKFVVRPKGFDDKEEKSSVLTIRIDKKCLEDYDKLAAKSGRSRNSLIKMALQYALDNLEFVSDKE